MATPSYEEHPYFWCLLIWRALLALIAIYTVEAKPFATMLLTLLVLSLLFLVGEGVYKGAIYFEEENRRAQKDRELREKRAEEARLRAAALKEAQEASARQFMVFEEGKAGATKNTPPVATA